MVSFSNDIRDTNYNLLRDEVQRQTSLQNEKSANAGIPAPSMTAITASVRTEIGGFFSEKNYPRTDSEIRASKLKGDWGELND